MGLKHELGAIDSEELLAEYYGFYYPEGVIRPVEEQEQLLARHQFSGEYIGLQSLINHIAQHNRDGGTPRKSSV